MRRLLIAVAASIAGALSADVRAADPAAKPTHVLRGVLIEVAAAKSNGEAWDTAIGSYSRPDLQVTLMKHDEQALNAAAELYVAATLRRMEETGAAVPAGFESVAARTAAQSLRCGAAVAALQDAKLNEARARFAADTAVASDATLARLEGGGLAVALGDRVSIFVHDVDLAAHDLVGETEIQITKETLAEGSGELKFGSVAALQMKIEPIRD